MGIIQAPRDTIIGKSITSSKTVAHSFSYATVWAMNYMLPRNFYIDKHFSNGFTGFGFVRYNVGFDHGLPCRVKNMARGTQ